MRLEDRNEKVQAQAARPLCTDLSEKKLEGRAEQCSQASVHHFPAGRSLSMCLKESWMPLEQTLILLYPG